LNLGYLIGFKFILIYKIRNQEEIDIKTLTESSHVNSPVSIHKKADIFKSINILISKFMNHYDRVIGINPIQDDGKVCEFFLPRNFSWINSERILAGSAIPSKDEHICGLFNNGIRHIITLQEFPLEILDKYSKYIKSSYFYVVDRTPLTIEQLEKCCTLIHDSLINNESVLIHCQGGVGRTNMAIAAYLMKYKNFSMSEALESLQQHRKVLLTVSQTQTLKNWWGFIHNKELDDKTPITNLLDSKRPSMNILKFLPNVLLLCGYAASGKSTFSKTLLSAYPNIFVRINKDEMRGKGEIDKMIFEYMNEIKENKKVLIIDCCNLTVKARLEWIDCFKSFVIWCLYFNIPIEECKYRIKLRVDHPTILDGISGQKILTTMEKIIEPPTQSEGFEKLIIFNSENCVASTLKEWHINPSTLESSIDSIRHGIIKFPKIPHLFNLGGATRDDKICTPSDISKFIGQKVIIEEKIDGANVGISIDDNGCILVQNRSHFITSNYHAQFAPLDKWIAKHMSDLWEILTPNRHILFGEWVYATHSIPYDLLPGWFIAYDLYDKVNNTFMSRIKLSILLNKSNIPYVPVIFEDYIESIESLKSYVTGKSKYSSHAVREGIVIRVFDDENNLKFRAKIVRGDFLAGNERWNKLSKLATNSLIIK
jgi:atypical dual specificity phosphatase